MSFFSVDFFIYVYMILYVIKKVTCENKMIKDSESVRECIRAEKEKRKKEILYYEQKKSGISYTGL